MTASKLIAAGLAPLVVLGLSACESTQDRAKKIQENAEASVETGISIAKENPSVKVVDSAVLSDKNGAAAVVELRNTSKQPIVNAPIVIEVADAKGVSLYRNDIPGLDETLTHVAYLPPGETVAWVNDQLLTSGKPKSVKAQVGVAETAAPGKLPDVEISKPGPLTEDEISGVNVEGKVTNKSKVEQRKLVISGVARQGGKVVAAGRSVIKVLKTTKPAHYRIYFIGDPKGAQLEIAGYPTTFQ